MARRRTKKRTHAGAANGASAHAPNSSASRGPKSMVIRIGAGEVGSSVSQLVKDVRSMMEPGTASRLKERRSNRLRDYTTMAGPLGISHLLLFSRSSSGNTNLRLALTPRGPTLHFRVEKYSLCKDVLKVIKHPKGGGKEYLTAPLLVMNNFSSQAAANGEGRVPKHLEALTTTIFQSLFPPINPQTTPLSTIRRVLLLNRELPSTLTSEAAVDNGSYVLNLRHYAIITKRTGVSRRIRRLNGAEKVPKKKGKDVLPNLGKLEDMADYLLDPAFAEANYTSGSETEAETDAEVEVLETKSRRVLSKKQLDEYRQQGKKIADMSAPEVEKRAVKLVELGPRMKLRLTKVEEGVCGGKVMWHEYLTKSREEVKKMEEIWETRKKIREDRKRVQRENLERKRKERGLSTKEDDTKDYDLTDDDWDSEELENDDHMDVDEDQQVPMS